MCSNILTSFGYEQSSLFWSIPDLKVQLDAKLIPVTENFCYTESKCIFFYIMLLKAVIKLQRLDLKRWRVLTMANNILLVKH